MIKQLPIDEHMNNRRINIIDKLERIADTNPILFTNIIRDIPPTVYMMLYRVYIDTDYIDNFVAMNGSDKVTKIIDKRNIDETVYNYYISMIAEIIAYHIIKSMGFNVIRNGSDNDLKMNNKINILYGADLAVEINKEWVPVEVQFCSLNNSNIIVKKGKADSLIKKNTKTIFFILGADYNEDIEYITFYISRAVKASTTVIKVADKAFGGKDTYSINISQYKKKTVTDMNTNSNGIK